MSAAKIHILPDRLISQIAAGEVVERPASVVKELVENSLDAGATEIRIELENGGKRRIRVTDDGVGMGKDDSLLAFDRHATSKIETFDDLETVASLGFRGEALASIAAVARVELSTAQVDGEGHRVRVDGGNVVLAEPISRARGTTLDVASLFYNVPARRKFLKTPQTELRHCLLVAQGYALARPDVRFTVESGGRRLLEALGTSEGQEGARERIAQVFGSEEAGSLVPLAPEAEGEGTGRPGERIHGFVGIPDSGKARRSFVFVNRRLLRDRAVLATFYRAVREEWKTDRFPSLFLFLDLPPEDVDVNVHPQKAEVRFRDRRFLDQLYGRLRRALERARGEAPAPLRQPAEPPRGGFSWQGLGGRRPEVSDPGGWRAIPGEGTEVRQPTVPYGGGAPAAEGRIGAGEPRERLATARIEGVGERKTVPLSGRRGTPAALRLIGQYKGSLLLMEGPEGLYLVDQHAAHERVLYERLRRELAGEATRRQRLVTPLVLEVSAAERLRLEELADGLEACGFEVAPLSGSSVAVAAVPAVLATSKEAPAPEELLLELAASEPAEAAREDGADGSAELLSQQILEALAASQACKKAIKIHHPLTAAEMESLIAELFTAEQPYACPHGRPTVLEMSDADLERRFGRR